MDLDRSDHALRPAIEGRGQAQQQGKAGHRAPLLPPFNQLPGLVPFLR